MIKSIKQKLSVKIFLITFFLLGIACSGTYFCISNLLPTTYSNLINKNTERAAIQLADQLGSYDSISNCEEALSGFSKKTNAVFWVESQNGSIVYPADNLAETGATSGDTIVTFDKNEPYIDVILSGEISTKFYPITLKSGDTYTLAVQADLFVVRQTTAVLWSIFPYVLLMIFLLSLLCSLLYARYITRPIVRLSRISKQIAELDFSGHCNESREDELGCLAHNLNSLSAALSTALDDLQAANQKLRADIEREQELERQRVDFFSAASHELKTPLTILKGHLTGMLSNISGYENHTAYMERSLAVVNKMEILVKELLYISKADGKKKSEYITVDFSELVRIQIAAVTELLTEKEQRLEVDIPDKVLCELEPSQMERAIQNILVNAVRYSPKGELIHISLTETDDIICCKIENTGVHIPEDAIVYLFDAFYCADTSRNRNTGGTGLGLYIVRKIMEMHHIKYGIKNSNSGVLFWMMLPKKQQFLNSI